MYRRYYSYNDMPAIPKQKPPEKKEECLPAPDEKKLPGKLTENGKFNLQTDDLILLIVIFILLADSCDDSLLLLALAFLFFNS